MRSAPVDAAKAGRIRRALDDHVHVERLSRTFRALGDPTRSKMVFALSLEELRPSELAVVLGTSLSAMSHQLRILRDLDIVRVRRSGKSQVYALNERAFGFCAPRLCQAWQQTEGSPLVGIEHASSARTRSARPPSRGRRAAHPRTPGA